MEFALMHSAPENPTPMKGTEMANRPSSSVKDRRWKRVPLDVRVKAVVMEDGRKTVIYGRSSQISEGGMGVTMTREMPKGTVATLIFKLPGEQNERVLQAEVKYRSGFRCGLEFLGISLQTRKELLRFCTQASQYTVPRWRLLRNTRGDDQA